MKKERILTVRLTPEILGSLDELALRKRVSRAAIARSILANCNRFDEFLEAETAKSMGSNIRLEEDLAREVQENLNKQIDPVMAKMMAEVMKRTMERVIQLFSTSGGGDSNK